MNGGNNVRFRILNVSDLVAPETCYHVQCYMDLFYVKSENPVRQPKNEIENIFWLYLRHTLKAVLTANLL